MYTSVDAWRLTVRIHVLYICIFHCKNASWQDQHKPLAMSSHSNPITSVCSPRQHQDHCLQGRGLVLCLKATGKTLYIKLFRDKVLKLWCEQQGHPCAIIKASLWCSFTILSWLQKYFNSIS